MLPFEIYTIYVQSAKVPWIIYVHIEDTHTLTQQYNNTHTHTFIAQAHTLREQCNGKYCVEKREKQSNARQTSSQKYFKYWNTEELLKTNWLHAIQRQYLSHSCIEQAFREGICLIRQTNTLKLRSTYNLDQTKLFIDSFDTS